VWINPQSTATVTARACLDTMDSEQTIDRPTLWYRPVPSGGVAPLPPQECPLWGSVASCQIPIGGRIFVSAATNMGVSLNTGGIQTAEVDYEAAFDAFLPESRKVDRSDLGIDYWKAGAAPALSEELKEPPGDFGTPMSPDSLNVPPDPIQPGGEPEGGRSEY
ncbi:MAG TPA: hypothetical protein PKY30_26900, partial [Myxococcota bacterium]|nr:hypothetical protein [Myxococcota bacterium]